MSVDVCILAGETEYREMREEKKDSAIRSRRTETNFAARLSSGVLSKPQDQINIFFWRLIGLNRRIG